MERPPTIGVVWRGGLFVLHSTGGTSSYYRSSLEGWTLRGPQLRHTIVREWDGHTISRTIYDVCLSARCGVFSSKNFGGKNVRIKEGGTLRTDRRENPGEYIPVLFSEKGTQDSDQYGTFLPDSDQYGIFLPDREESSVLIGVLISLRRKFSR